MNQLLSLPSLKKIYLISLFLVIAPPIFFFASYLNLNSLAKILWVFVFFALTIKRRWKIQKGPLLLLFSAFFISQSFSILGAINIVSFLEQYEDLFFAAVFFFVSVSLVGEAGDIKKVVLVLLGAGIVNFLFQAVIFLLPDLFLRLGPSFLHPGYVEIIKVNINRDRIYFESYDEILIPALIYIWVRLENKIVSTASFFYALLLTALSFLSNFRTRFVMLAFSLFSSLLVFIKVKKRFVLGLVFVPLTIYFLYSILNLNKGFTVFDRLFFQDEREDVSTVRGRLKRWDKTIEMGLSAPIFGVGLGNYYDNLDPFMKQNISLFEQNRKEFELAAYDPHGIFFKIFAETGFLGLFSFLALLAYFVKKDINVLFGDKEVPKIFAIGFWTLFLYSLVNPTFTVKYQTLFWLLRILEEASLKDFTYDKILKIKA